MGYAHTSAIVGLIALIAISPFVGAASVQPGWNVTFLEPNVFLGDPINITVTGPLQFNNSTVKIQLVDPSGIQMRNYYSIFTDGESHYNYTTSINSTPGTWIVSAYLGEDKLLARSELILIFDEVNYLSKRVAMIEAQNKHQEEFILRLIQENKELSDRINWALLIVPIGVGATVIVLLWMIIDVGAPLRRVIIELEKRYGPQTQQKLLKNFETWLLNPESTSELKQYHIRMRLMSKPKWPADSIADRAVEYARQHGLATARPIRLKNVVVKDSPILDMRPEMKIARDAQLQAMQEDSQDIPPATPQKRSKTRVGE